LLALAVGTALAADRTSHTYSIADIKKEDDPSLALVKIGMFLRERSLMKPVDLLRAAFPEPFAASSVGNMTNVGKMTDEQETVTIANKVSSSTAPRCAAAPNCSCKRARPLFMPCIPLTRFSPTHGWC
jgi:hypothetical protein